MDWFSYFIWFLLLMANVGAAMTVFRDVAKDYPTDIWHFSLTLCLTPANIIIASLVMRGGC